ncbi:MAG: hypothetical protein KF752_15940 [Pirellulaceae bacterium]|nr:hypothetical protein [Pirellulaceae bacterium]
MSSRHNQFSVGMILLLCSIQVCSVGCRSGASWRSPSTWFASRAPDPTVIAGRTDAPQLPTSPAEKYTPMAIMGSGSSATASTASQATTAYPAATGGLAAQANGYQTGPYSLTNTPANPSQPVGGFGAPLNATLASNPTNTPVQPANTSTSGSFPSPYGGSYSGVSHAQTALPNTSAVGNAQSAPYSTSPTNLPQNSPIGYPALSGSGSMAAAASTVSGPVSPSSGNVPAVSYPNASSTGNGYPYTSPNSNTLNGGVVPAASAYQSGTPTGTFAPGTTGRTTSYNFAPGATTGTSAPAQSGINLPPNTATGNGQLMR